MDTVNASDAKREFGSLLMRAQKEAVGINKNGKPVAVVLSASEFADLQELKHRALKQEIDKGMADIQAGRISDGSDVFERIGKLVRDGSI
ncbi:MAG: type II toxin-antitoxin system Phd/YefM family antitoxin [Pseudohongiellaceae bacterium]